MASRDGRRLARLDDFPEAWRDSLRREAEDAIRDRDGV